MSTTNSSSSPSKFQVEVQNMLTGLGNNVPATLRSMMINGSSMTIVQVVAKFQDILDVLQAVSAAKTAYQHAVAARKAELVADRTFYANVVTILKQTFGTGDQTALAGFGILPAKARTKPSSNTKSIAYAKSLATRAARGTMGKKQKLAITTAVKPTVSVTGVGATPLTPVAPAASTPAASTPAAEPVPVTPAPHA